MRLTQIPSEKPIQAMSFRACVAKTDAAGKPGTGVLEHSQNVAEVARQLSDCLPPRVRDLLACHVLSTAAVHDIGKVSPGFQLKISRDKVARHAPALAREAAENYELDHCHTGASALWRHLGNPFAPPAAVGIVAMHHGSASKPPLPSDLAEPFGGEPWARERAALLAELEATYGAVPSATLPPAIRNLLAGAVTVSDWIGSDERFFTATGLPEGADRAAVAAMAVNKCGLRTPQVTPGLSFNEVFGNQPYRMQEAFAETVQKPGMYLLEAPMGMGKTEAALYAAYCLMAAGHNSGIFFGLPTRLTSNRIHQRVSDFLKRICPQFPDVKLAHGTAWLEAFRHGGEAFRPGNAWFNPRKRSLLHPFVVGTIDQALLSVLRVRHFFVRTFALAGKVVILDEVHSYDGYTGTLLEDMTGQLLEVGCTVIVLSATLTAERRKAFFANPENLPDGEAYPLISSQVGTVCTSTPGEPPEAREYSTRMEDWETEQVADQAVHKAGNGHCVLAIANSVAKAQEWYNAVSTRMVDRQFEVGLLHSKFPAFQRSELEDTWMGRLGKPGPDGRRPQGCVLVATQVVEQSVDIDSDYLITELAPTDMLLQRMGRQWRHPRESRPSPNPEVVIVGQPVEDAESLDEIIERLGKVNSLIYSPYVLWRTRKVWQGKSTIVLPTDIRALLEATYREEPCPTDAACKLRRKHEEQCDKLRDLARAYSATATSLPTGEDREGIATRYSDLPNTHALLVREFDCTGHQADILLFSGRQVHVDAWTPDIPVTAALHENLVTIATHVLAKAGALDTPDCLKRHFHEPTPVLVWDEYAGDLLLDGKPTGLEYRAELGVVRRRQTPTGQPAAPTAPGSDYDDYDVFDKERFDW